MMFLPTCRELSEGLARGEFDHTSRASRFFRRLHLLMCRYCRRYERQLKLLGEGARKRFGRIEPGKLSEVQARILKKLSGA